MLFYSVTFPIFVTSILLWGVGIQRIIGGPNHTVDISNTETPPPCDIAFTAAWLGVSILSGILSFVALISPLSPTIALLILALPAIGLIQRSYRHAVATLFLDLIIHQTPRYRLACTIILLVLPVCFLGSQQTILFDTAYYHLPVARILEEFGTVKGLVTLHMNFGQVSSWLVLGAPGTVGGELGWGSSLPNTFICMLAAVQVAFSLDRIVDGSRRLCDFIVGIGFLLIFLLAARWGMIASLSPDLPAMLLAVAIAWLLSLHWGHRGVFFAIPVAAFAITIKLSALPVGLIAGIATLYAIREESRLFIVSVCVGLAILAPFLLLSVLSTGCLAFPLSLTCFELPWTPSAEQLSVHTETIVAAARGGGRALPADTPLVTQFLTWASRDKSGALIILSGVLISTTIVIRDLFFDKSRHSGTIVLYAPHALAICGLVYVLVMAPTGRFAGGYTSVLAAVLIASIPSLTSLFKMFTATWLIPLGFVVGIINLHLSGPGNVVRVMVGEQVATGDFPDPGSGIFFPKRLVPFDIHHPETRRLRKWSSDMRGSVKFQRATSTGECWAAPPPCLPQGAKPNIKYIHPDRGIGGGFYIAK